MMNKKNLWFLTLFSLVLVLSIYYVTMPNDLLKASTSSISNTIKKASKVNEVTKEADAITALKVEDEAKTKDTLGELQKKITNSDTTTDEKNKAYEELKDLSNREAEEENLETKIKKNYDLSSFVKLEDNTISVVLEVDKHDVKLANNIMRCIQEEYEGPKTISVKFS